MPAKKSSTKKTAAKKTAAKKTAAKKTAAKKTAAKKTAATKTAAKKTAAKKTAAKKTAAKRPGRTAYAPSVTVVGRTGIRFRPPGHVAGKAQTIAARFAWMERRFAKPHARAWYDIAAHLDEPATRVALAQGGALLAIETSIAKIRAALDDRDDIRAEGLSYSAIKAIAAALPGRVTVPPPPRRTVLPGDPALRGRVTVPPPPRRR
ncbi:MAG TPA: histone H1-like repetitive region-containing protein [Candidatus Elarobacter sp.]|jgi:hypothetical protein|nr:histone H1-like repetitive region-containing protein [Candidatus Elarobacter sp.]